MKAFLLAIMISGSTGLDPGSIPLGLFTDVQDCIEVAGKIVEHDILKDEHDIWCIPVKLEDGYASAEGEIELLE